MTVRSIDVLRHAAELAARNEPHVLATVVWCRPPTSAKPGDRALVTADGELVGWIGGGCSEPAVVRECLRALREGTTRLLHLGPPGERREPRAGEVIETIRCASEGSLEVFVEPHPSRPHLVIVGDAPVAGALARLAEAIEYDVDRVEPVESELDLQACGVRPGSHIVVATLGRSDEAALEAALATPAAYIALVGSRKRAAAVRETLRRSGVPEEELGRIRAPAGLDLGRIAHAEIAVAILAEIVQERAKRGPRLDAADESGDSDEAPSEPERVSESAPDAAHAIDPVCGMTVAVEGARFTAERDGRTYYFCCDGCRRRFESEPARYASAGGD